MALEPTTQSVAANIACPSCGYDLRGIPSDKCPECGIVVDRAATSVSRIPWEHRRQIGTWRAYWRTNCIVLFRPGILAEETNRPVNFRIAQRFRHATVVLAAIPLLVWGVSLYGSRIGIRYFPEGAKLGWLLEGLALAIALFVIWLFLFAFSGIGSYFFHPRSMSVARQNRAIAISYYGCAALAWLWLPAGLLALGLGVMSQSDAADDMARRAAVPVIVGAFALLGAVLIAWWARMVLLMRMCTQAGLGRTLCFAAYLPISGLCLFGLCWALIAAVVMVSLAILSLT